MSTLVAHGLVREDNGQLVLDNRSSFAADVKRFAGKRVTVTVEEEKDQRSLAQNARFWKICELAAEAWSVGRDLPLHKDQAKDVLCGVFLGKEDTPLGPASKGTKHLTVAQMARLMSDIEEYFRDLGQALPLDRCD